MAGMKEYDYPWTFTSTGIGTWANVTWARQHTFLVETAAGSTCSMQMLTRRKGSTAVSVLGSSATFGASSQIAITVTGNFFEVAPRIKTLTSTGTVYVQGIGNS
jgi:hypothetical protein